MIKYTFFLKMSQPGKRKYPLRGSSNKKSKSVLSESTKVNTNHNITTKPTTSVQEIINKIGQSNGNRKNNMSNVSGSLSPINVCDDIELGEVVIHTESNNIKIGENSNNNNDNDGLFYFYLFYYLLLLLLFFLLGTIQQW